MAITFIKKKIRSFSSSYKYYHLTIIFFSYHCFLPLLYTPQYVRIQFFLLPTIEQFSQQLNFQTPQLWEENSCLDFGVRRLLQKKCLIWGYLLEIYSKPVPQQIRERCLSVYWWAFVKTARYEVTNNWIQCHLQQSKKYIQIQVTIPRFSI